MKRRIKSHARSVALFACLSLLLLSLGGFSGPSNNVRANAVAQLGRSYVETVGYQRVLHVEGTPYEMGYAHGRLLAKQARQTLEWFIGWAVERGTSEAQLREIYRSFEPNLPLIYKEEMRGLADGAGIDIERVKLAHAIPSRYHCTGAAVWGEASADGHLYHTRSLDYSLHIGGERKVQDNALLIVAKPAEGIGHAYLSWAGFVGAVSGMNEAGVSLGEMGSKCSDETTAGVPMIFLCREVLRRARNVDEGAAIFRSGPRTAGFNFILAQAEGEPRAIAIELSRSRMVVYNDDDPAERNGPHKPLKQALRRSNHFVGEKMARLQAHRYTSRKLESTASFLAYQLMGEFIAKNRGKLDAARMIELLRLYPPSHPCLHQAVFCPTRGTMWVSQALSPRPGRNVGAQNNTFYRYDLKALLAGRPARDGLQTNGPNHELSAANLRVSEATGRIRESAAALAGAHKLFQYEPGTFDYSLVRVDELPWARVYHVKYPSAMVTEHESNNVVHAELYEPTGEVKGAAVVLHILKGRFAVARLVANYLVHNQIAALIVKLPYYGERNPGRDENGRKIKMISANLERTRRSILQGVMDVRRGVSFLLHRNGSRSGRVGLVGVSLGAMVGSLAMANDLRIDHGVLVLGGGDLPYLFWHGKETAKLRASLQQAGIDLKQVSEQIRDVDPLTYAPSLQGRKVLMINAKGDAVIPEECVRRFHTAAGKPEILWIDASHYSAILYVNDILRRTVRFLLSP